MHRFASLSFTFSFALLAVTAVACGGETLDVGDKAGAGDADGGAVNSSTAATSPSSSSSTSASSDGGAPVNPDFASLSALAQTSGECTLDDVRGPFTGISDAPLVALGLNCPSVGPDCYVSHVPNNGNYVVCIDAEGKVECASDSAVPMRDNYGYDCCFSSYDGAGSSSDQCYWLVKN